MRSSHETDPPRWRTDHAAPAFAALLCTESSAAQTAPPPLAKYPALPSETPASFEPTNGGFEYIRRDVMITMRDGVKLHTVILVPKGAPILLTRTPYDATRLTTHHESNHLASILDGYDSAVETIVEGGYDHGADPVELVPALRPQPAALRAQHLLGQGRGLPQGVQRIYHAPGLASFVELPLITTP